MGVISLCFICGGERIRNAPFLTTPFQHAGCEATNLLQAQKPRKIKIREKLVRKVGFLEFRKVRQKQVQHRFLCKKTNFYLLFTSFRPTFRISRKPTFHLLLPYFNFRGVGACSRFAASQHTDCCGKRKARPSPWS